MQSLFLRDVRDGERGVARRDLREKEDLLGGS